MAPTTATHVDDPSAEAPRVQTRTGWLEGSRSGAVNRFFGIPYGEPPVGTLRFRAPEAHHTWEGIRPATSLGPQCVQNNPDFPAWLDTSPESEDCLVLNVWAPVAPACPRPVMVWLHGGGFVYGSAGAPIYDGAVLADRGNVVVVSINHRLNVFGYAWFGDLIPELAEHGNPGQRDVELALTWVRDNVDVFGGDPDNVTVFGESGGGGKISTLCASPSAHGLFHKMIIQSGVPTRIHHRDAATGVTRVLLDELGIANPTEQLLRDLNAEPLIAAAAAVEAQLGLLAFQPVADGEHIADQLWSQRILRDVAAVPLLIGTTSEETIAFDPDLGTGQPSTSELIEQLSRFAFSPSLAHEEWARLLEEYQRLMPEAGTEQLAIALTTDLTFWPAAQELLRLRAQNEADNEVGYAAANFAYEFDWKTPCYGATWAPHAGELPFLFGNLKYPTAWDGTDNDDLRAKADPHGQRFKLSEAMIAAWTAFARNGDPSTPQWAWPRWSGPTGTTMVLGEGSCRPVTGLKQTRWEIIKDLPRPW